MAVSVCPAVSSAARIAPTWPSIIPDGATTSAPASACDDRDRRVPLEGGVVVDVTLGGEHAAVAVVGVLVEAVVGDEHEVVADLVAQVAQRRPARRRRRRRPASRWRPCAPARRRGSPPAGRGRRAPAPPCAGSPGCAARPRASKPPARGRRCPPSRTGARRGRRPRGGLADETAQGGSAAQAARPLLGERHGSIVPVGCAGSVSE